MGGLALMVILAATLSGEGEVGVSEDSLGQPYATIPIPSEIDTSFAKNSCINAALAREWDIVSKKGNIIEINLAHRSWNATVFFVVNDDEIVMYSDSYVVNKKTGERKRKKDPEGWLKNLRKDIEKLFDQKIYLE